MKPKILLLENSHPLHGLQSLYIKKFIEQRIKSPFYLLLWNKPGWQSSTDCDTFKDYSNNFDSATPFNVQHIYDIYHQAQNTNAHLDFALNFFTKFTSPNDFLGLTYKGTRVGLGALSTLLRHYSECYSGEYIDMKLYSAYLNPILESVDFITNLACKYDIIYAFFSETVYQTLPLIDAVCLVGGSVPLLLDPGAPCIITKEDFTESIKTGYSPRMLAAWKARRKILELSNKEVYKYREVFKTYDRNKSVNDELVSTQYFYSHISSKHGKKLLSLSSTRENLELLAATKPNIINVVLHLHAITDGPFFVGDSGFLSPHHFFLAVLDHFIKLTLNRKSSNSHTYKLFIKPHPNILVGLNSAYSSHKSKALFELRVSRLTFNQLAHLLNSYSIMEWEVLDPLSSAIEVIDLFPSSTIHVTHHGTCSLEAFYLGAKLICSKIAPVNRLNFAKNLLIVNPSTSPLEIENLVRDCPESSTLSIEQIQECIVLDRYYSKYRRIYDSFAKFSGLLGSKSLDMDIAHSSINYGKLTIKDKSYTSYLNSLERQIKLALS